MQAERSTIQSEAVRRSTLQLVPDWRSPNNAMINPSYLWQLLNVKTAGMTTVGVVTAEAAGGHDSVVLVAVIGGGSALIVALAGKALDAITERWRARKADQVKALQIFRESDVRRAELDLQERMDMMDRRERADETAMKIYEQQVKGLEAALFREREDKEKQIAERDKRIAHLERELDR